MIAKLQERIAVGGRYRNFVQVDLLQGSYAPLEFSRRQRVADDQVPKRIEMVTLLVGHRLVSHVAPYAVVFTCG